MFIYQCDENLNIVNISTLEGFECPKSIELLRYLKIMNSKGDLMKRGLTVIGLILLIFLIHFFLPKDELKEENLPVQIDAPAFVLSEVPFDLKFIVSSSVDSSSKIKLNWSGISQICGDQKKVPESEFIFETNEIGISGLVAAGWGSRTIQAQFQNLTIKKTIRVIPGVLSLLPPLVAILLALIARRVLVALFCGSWLGVSLIYDYDPLLGFLRLLDKYLINSLADPDHVAIVMFSMTLGGMVGVISRSGGTQGIVEKITRFANNRRGGQLVTWGMGVLVFFDDYANTLIVGNTMRPFTDKLKISREKLSYMVDSTAAPVASVFPISTWVGFQIALIATAFAQAGIEKDAYLVFVESIPYASYSVLAVLFVFLIGLTLRDFGPMLKSESRAFQTGQLVAHDSMPLIDSSGIDAEVPENIPRRWYNALLPIFTVIFVTLIGLYFQGKAQLATEGSTTASLREIISAANSFNVLMWAAVSGAFVAMLLAISQKILTLPEAVESWLSGVKSMVLAMIILVLAWSIGKVCEDLFTAQYVVHLTEKLISPHFLPVITFVVAALIGFSTGTSWATMAILIPIVVPIAVQLAANSNLEPGLAHSILLGTIGAVLSGSVFGDHSSPISDTTIMSSMASAADHIDHVRTQLPYAIAVAIVAVFFGYLPAGFGWNIYLTLGLGLAVLLVLLFVVGKRVGESSRME